MKKFVFLFVVPVVAGIVSSKCGASYFVDGELVKAICINIPICCVSSVIAWR